MLPMLFHRDGGFRCHCVDCVVAHLSIAFSMRFRRDGLAINAIPARCHCAVNMASARQSSWRWFFPAWPSRWHHDGITMASRWHRDLLALPIRWKRWQWIDRADSAENLIFNWLSSSYSIFNVTSPFVFSHNRLIKKNALRTDRRTDGRTDGWTDGPTDGQTLL